MALISCPECEKEMSEFAPSCPGCGFAPAVYVQEANRRFYEAEREEKKRQFLDPHHRTQLTSFQIGAIIIALPILFFLMAVLMSVVGRASG